jgi:hypothetical protein
MITTSFTPGCIAISTPVASILMTRFFIALMERSARKTRAEAGGAAGARIASYPVGIQAVGWGLLGTWTALAIGITIYQATRNQAPYRGMLIGAAVVAVLAAMVAEFTRVRVEWTDTALSFDSPWAAPWADPSRIAWEDIVQVKYSASARWFVVRGRDGTKIRLHYWLGGLADLFDDMKLHVSDELRAQIETAMKTEFPS